MFYHIYILEYNKYFIIIVHQGWFVHSTPSSWSIWFYQYSCEHKHVNFNLTPSPFPFYSEFHHVSRTTELLNSTKSKYHWGRLIFGALFLGFSFTDCYNKLVNNTRCLISLFRRSFLCLDHSIQLNQVLCSLCYT